jgi:PPM family protein phosphatase
MALTRTEPELIIAQATHEGMSGKHNEDNLDSFCWQVNGRLLHVGVVADGIGGQIAGELASRLAVEAVGDYFDRLPELSGNLTDHLAQAITVANEAVYQHSQTNRELQGMGTTMVIAGILDGRLYTAYVGDSRIYLLRDGRLRQITVDHTWAQEAIEAGLLTREQAKTHPNRNVIKRFLGGFPEVEVDRRLSLQPNQSQAEMLTGQGLRLRAGDTILLCSDGLSDMISDDAIHDSLYNHFLALDTAAVELIAKANDAGGKDNITVVIMQIPGGKPVAPVGTRSGIYTTGIRTGGAPVAAAPAPVPTTAPASSAASWRWPLLLLGGGLLGLMLLLGVGAMLIFGLNNSGQNQSATATGAPTGQPLEGQSAPTDSLPEGPAATAAILLPTNGADETTSPATIPGNGSATPALIPTLRATPTATRVSLPGRTSSPTPTSLVTATPQPASPPPGGNNQNTPVPATNTPAPMGTTAPVPTNTAPPPATNTSPPPTNTPLPPTNTPVPPTNTPVPPTDTPVPPTNTPPGNRPP